MSQPTAPPASSSSSQRVRVAVLGANGRMGRAVVRLAHAAGMQVVCAIGVGDEGRDAGELAGIGAIGTKIATRAEALEGSGAQVLIDFSAPAALVKASQICAASRTTSSKARSGGVSRME